jgi:hypothetical protein
MENFSKKLPFRQLSELGSNELVGRYFAETTIIFLRDLLRELHIYKLLKMFQKSCPFENCQDQVKIHWFVWFGMDESQAMKIISRHNLVRSMAIRYTTIFKKSPKFFKKILFEKLHTQN